MADALVPATWALVASTVGLVAATIALVWFTRNLVTATTRLVDSSERLERQNAAQFERSGSWPQVVYPQLERWEPDAVSPGQPYRLWVRFSVSNPGRMATTIGGAVLKLPGTPWENGMPLVIDEGVPVRVEPANRTPILHGYCTVWPDDARALLRRKKATIYAFTPSGQETASVDFPLYGLDLEPRRRRTTRR
jgi:hypothetical protein